MLKLNVPGFFFKLRKFMKQFHLKQKKDKNVCEANATTGNYKKEIVKSSGKSLPPPTPILLPFRSAKRSFFLFFNEC